MGLTVGCGREAQDGLSPVAQEERSLTAHHRSGDLRAGVCQSIGSQDGATESVMTILSPDKTEAGDSGHWKDSGYWGDDLGYEERIVLAESAGTL